MPTVTVRIENGEAVVTTAGFTGKACQDATADLEKALGMKTKDRPTAEMSKPVTSTLTQRG